MISIDDCHQIHDLWIRHDLTLRLKAILKLSLVDLTIIILVQELQRLLSLFGKISRQEERCPLEGIKSGDHKFSRRYGRLWLICEILRTFISAVDHSEIVFALIPFTLVETIIVEDSFSWIWSLENFVVDCTLIDVQWYGSPLVICVIISLISFGVIL